MGLPMILTPKVGKTAVRHCMITEPLMTELIMILRGDFSNIMAEHGISSLNAMKVYGNSSKFPP